MIVLFLIETPDGERYRYRSPKLYCGQGPSKWLPWLGIPPDISIFGQSGGYTFRRPGRHLIWVEYGLGKGNRLKSNVAAVDVYAGESLRT